MGFRAYNPYGAAQLVEIIFGYIYETGSCIVIYTLEYSDVCSTAYSGPSNGDPSRLCTRSNPDSNPDTDGYRSSHSRRYRYTDTYGNVYTVCQSGTHGYDNA